MNTLNAENFKAMIKSGAANLENHRQEVDALNVFPVPDGDTGTNMSMTFTNGYKEAMNCSSNSVSDVAKALSKGLLMGARGNSGVITSQIFRGFYQAIEEKEIINVKEIADAFENGARVAYKAIMKPVEGTILTVIREASWYANHDLESKPEMDLLEYFTRLHAYCIESVEHTPDYLPVLKEAGVVDSGGTGLSYIIEGFRNYVANKPNDFVEQQEVVIANPALELENDEFGYCTEFIFRINKDNINSFDENILKKKLAEIGESLVVVKDDDLVKVHVHTLKPGDALNIAQRYGEFIKLKIENMQEQHSTITANAKKEETNKETQEYGIIAVAAGKGLEQLFKDYGADIVITGGQTMNPSTEDFVAKIEELSNCRHIFIFPNNSNIIMAAKQAQGIKEELDITVIPTTSIQEGLTAVGLFNRMGSVEDNIEDIQEEIKNVDSASITYAVKDTTLNGIKINEGDYLALLNKHIVASGKNKLAVIKALLDEMLKNKDKEVLTIIAGEDSNKEECEKIQDYLANCSDVEVEIKDGGQPVYEYLFSFE